jgi:hypothetical protein
MSRDAASTRRSFLGVGAIAAVPIAAAGSAMAVEHEAAKARLARLQDEAALRELHRTWLRQVNAGERDGSDIEAAVRSLRPDLEAEADAIEVSSDVRHASGRFHLIAELETALPRDCTLAQMAHAQGEGFIRRAERRVLEAGYLKGPDGTWAIASLELKGA